MAKRPRRHDSRYVDPVKTADDVGKLEPALLFLPGWCANRTVFEDLVAQSGRHRPWHSIGEGMASQPQPAGTLVRRSHCRTPWL